MIIETAALVALVLKNCVDVIKDINSASEESKSLWQKVKSIFSQKEKIKGFEANPDNPGLREIIALELQKELDKPINEKLKNEMASVVNKLQNINSGNISIDGDANTTVSRSSNVHININKDKS